MDNIIAKCQEAQQTVDAYYNVAKEQVSKLVLVDGKVSKELLNQEQHAAHGLAWIATYKETLREMLSWATNLESENRFTEYEKLILQFIFSEYLCQIKTGIPMSQLEVIRPKDLGLKNGLFNEIDNNSFNDLILNGNESKDRLELANIIRESVSSNNFGSLGIDETSSMIRDQFNKFVEEHVTPYAHEWHLKDALIPNSVLSKMAELGVFSIAIPEEYGGLGMGKEAMCVVTEELSRGFLAAGSLGTRAEIAGELIRLGGTEGQKNKFLPKIASGECLTTAVFTEPNTGSDLGNLQTRAILDGDEYRITGNKTWITHASRANLMTLLARSNRDKGGYKGLSMFLAPKLAGNDKVDFPDKGIKGGEIEVLGYRGMKEYEISFDDFRVDKKNLLGEEEGKESCFKYTTSLPWLSS